MSCQIVDNQRGLAPAVGGVLVPTMGALHAGHLTLVQRAASLGRPVVVSVFVNPTQFGPDEDFERYPRSLETDVEAAAAAGADLVFAPPVEVVYPPDEHLDTPRLPDAAAANLEDAQRPGHFAGVVQVVARLFDLARPSAAVFGEKDYQQLQVIRAMADAAAPRWGELSIIGEPTVREASGLALSSRNAYLSEEGRLRARGLSAALDAADLELSPGAAEGMMWNVMEAHGLDVDYAAVRDARTLAPLKAYEPGRPARAIVAARVDGVRLLDNGPVGPRAGRFGALLTEAESEPDPASPTTDE